MLVFLFGGKKRFLKFYCETAYKISTTIDNQAAQTGKIPKPRNLGPINNLKERAKLNNQKAHIDPFAYI